MNINILSKIIKILEILMKPFSKISRCKSECCECDCICSETKNLLLDDNNNNIL